MSLFYFFVFYLTLTAKLIHPSTITNCRSLLLPSSCRCYHSGAQSELHCNKIHLEFLPKLPNNLRWAALDFSSNNLTSVDSYVFSEIDVEKINLNDNFLQTVDPTAFDRIQTLKQLNLNRNQLETLDPQTFTSPGVSLEILDISFNPFASLDLGEIFLQLKVLKEFHAVSCQLNNSSLDTLLKLNEGYHQYIELIDLSHNNITSLCNQLFQGFYNVIELRLHHNHIYSIDHDFIRSLNYLKILNLAFNSIEYVPHLHSSSLENFNLSSNKIRSLTDHFAANLFSLRTIDFDWNQYLTSVSARSFCSVNLFTLEKVSFRSSNISSLNAFKELLCRLTDENHPREILNIHSNSNLECNCMLFHFEKYLINYSDLTCTQNGQDGYFIPSLTDFFSNCTTNVCQKYRKESRCQSTNMTQRVLQGTCQVKAMDRSKLAKNKFKPRQQVTSNSTVVNGKKQKSAAIAIRKKDHSCVFYLLLFIALLTFR